MQEVRRDGIRVSCVLPGSVNTEFGGDRPSAHADWKLDASDVARAVVDLLRHPARSLPFARRGRRDADADERLGAWIEDGSATGTIENHDPLPTAFIARFGRATAEQVVQHVEERMAAPRERGFRARFAGREFRPGMERDFALGFLSGFGQPMGASPMGGHPAGASAVGGAPMGPTTMGAHVSGHGVGAPGMAGGLPPAGASAAAMPRHGPSTGHGGGFLGSFLPGGDLFSNSEFELNRGAARRGRLRVEPQLPVALRRRGGRPVAWRRRAHDDVRRRLHAGRAGGRPVGRPHPGVGRLQRPERGADDLVDDRLLPVGGLPGERPRLGLGGDRVRHPCAEPGAGRRRVAGDGPVDGDDGGGDARRADRLAGHRGFRACVQGGRAVGRGGHRAGGRRGGPIERVRGRGDAGCGRRSRARAASPWAVGCR